MRRSMMLSCSGPACDQLQYCNLQFSTNVRKVMFGKGCGVRLLILFSMSCSLLTNEARGQSDTCSAWGRQIVRLVEAHFYDANRAGVWASRHADYAAHADSLLTFASLTKNALAELNTSHTDFYTPLEPDYYALLSIFREALGHERVEWESIGADFTQDHFVRVVFAGGPAEAAGLHRGDKVVLANDTEFDPVASFRGKNGRRVILTVERKPGERTINVPVIPRKVDPKQEWLEAQGTGSKIIERAGKKIAYVPMFSCTGDEYVEALRQAISQRFQEASALILDFRDGWGGCPPQFVNVFSPLPPIPVYTDRNSKQRNADAQWRKPLY